MPPCDLTKVYPATDVGTAGGCSAGCGAAGESPAGRSGAAFAANAIAQIDNRLTAHTRRAKPRSTIVMLQIPRGSRALRGEDAILVPSAACRPTACSNCYILAQCTQVQLHEYSDHGRAVRCTVRPRRYPDLARHVAAVSGGLCGAPSDLVSAAVAAATRAHRVYDARPRSRTTEIACHPYGHGRCPSGGYRCVGRGVRACAAAEACV